VSSANVRTLAKTFFEDNSAENLIDMSDIFGELNQVLTAAGLQPGVPWVGIEFVANEDKPVSLAADNTQGLYREMGSIILHIAEEAKIGVGASLLSRAEVLRKLFRGVRIGNIVVEGVTPPNFGRGATLEFDGGYMACTITIAYHADSSPP
jgi:hypothetical protein